VKLGDRMQEDSPSRSPGPVFVLVGPSTGPWYVVRRVDPRGVTMTPSESIVFVESRLFTCRHSSILHLLDIRVVGKSEKRIKSECLPFKLDEWAASYSKTAEAAIYDLSGKHGMPRDPLLRLSRDASWSQVWPRPSRSRGTYLHISQSISWK